MDGYGSQYSRKPVWVLILLVIIGSIVLTIVQASPPDNSSTPIIMQEITPVSPEITATPQAATPPAALTMVAEQEKIKMEQEKAALAQQMLQVTAQAQEQQLRYQEASAAQAKKLADIEAGQSAQRMAEKEQESRTNLTRAVFILAAGLGLAIMMLAGGWGIRSVMEAHRRETAAETVLLEQQRKLMVEHARRVEDAWRRSQMEREPLPTQPALPLMIFKHNGHTSAMKMTNKSTREESKGYIVSNSR